jgi:adenine deaminase
MVNKAIKLGVPPVVAIQMATINAAKHFRIEHLVGSLTPARWADIILAEDLHNIVPGDVYFKGDLVVEQGRVVVPMPSPEYPDWLFNTVRIKRGKRSQDYELSASGKSVDVWVIDLYPDQIINHKRKAALDVQDGVVQVDVSRDILKLAVVERHGKNGNIGIAFVCGFGIKNGALASSVAHDHHNIIVAGTNDPDMALCVEVLDEMQGGLVIASGGHVIGKLPLPIGGLLSELPVEDIISTLDAINQRYRELEGTLPAPFMTLSFIGLPTVPQLGLTDYGLVDVFSHSIIGTIVE